MDKKTNNFSYGMDQEKKIKEITNQEDEVSKNQKKTEKEEFLDLDLEKNIEFLEFIEKERSWNRNNSKSINRENTHRVEFNSNDENSDNIGEKKKANINLDKIMKMNYNYICCIDSRNKPDIYIGGKINLPAKNYRFSDTNKKILEGNQKIKMDLVNMDKDKSSENMSNKITDSIKKSKNYLLEENQEIVKSIDLSKLEEVEKENSLVENIEELRKIGKSYDSDADVDDDEKYESDDNAEKENKPKRFETRYFSQQNITMKCYNCGEIGHYARNCPNDVVMHCTKCNGEGHEENMCPNIKCFKCNRIGHKSYECKATKEIEKCSRCKNIGHLDEDCLINPYEIPSRVVERSLCPICKRKGVFICKGRRDYTLIDDYNSEEVNLSDSVDEKIDLNVGLYDILQGKVGLTNKINSISEKSVIKPGNILHVEAKDQKRKSKKSVIENLENIKIKDTIFCPKCAGRHLMKDCKVKLKDNEFDRMRQRYSQNMFRNNRDDYRRSTNNYNNRYDGSDKKKNQYRKFYDDDNSSNESINDIINTNSRKRKFSAASFNDFNDDYKGKNLSLEESSSEYDYKRNRKNKNNRNYENKEDRRGDNSNNTAKNNRDNDRYYNNNNKMTTNFNNNNLRNNYSVSKMDSNNSKTESTTLNNNEDNNFSTNLLLSNKLLYTNQNNKILLHYSNLHPNQPQQCLNQQNYPNFIQNNVYNILNQNNTDQNVYPPKINYLNNQNNLNNNSNLLQNLTNYINLKKQLNSQIHFNQNQINYNQNHLNFNNNSGILNNCLQNHNPSNIILPNHNYNSLNGHNLLNNILSQNNNIYLNEANFNSAYKIEKKNNEDIQFNLLNERGRKIIITSENSDKNKTNTTNNNNFNNEFLNKKRKIELAEQEYNTSKGSNFFYNNRLNNNSSNRNSSYYKGNNRNNKNY